MGLPYGAAGRRLKKKVGTMTFDEWFKTVPEPRPYATSLCVVWDAAVKATIQALLDSGNLSEAYREEWTATAKTLLTGEE